MNLYAWLGKNDVKEYSHSDIEKSAIVFSPHFGDETLGCGGIMIKKKRAGADVKLVFMTDRSKSHSNLNPADELTKIWSNEGIAVAQSMGIEKSDVFYLGLKKQN